MRSEAYAYDLFTAGKTPEFAIFFNLAHSNLEKYIQLIRRETTVVECQGDDLKKVNFFKNPEELSNEVFLYLREYLWKGNAQNKNSNGHSIHVAEKELICEILKKLEGIRNFHSHIWHINDVLKFSAKLYQFIMNLHNVSVSKISSQVSKNARLYLEQRKEYPFFKQHNGDYFITQEGRLYFLSFFLNNGEMQLLLSQSKGTKQNNLPEFKFKHEVFTYYCHREGSNWDSSGIQTEELKTLHNNKMDRILKGRQAFRILNYLNDDPITNLVDTIPLLYTKNEKIEQVNNASSLIEFIQSKEILEKIKLTVLETDLSAIDNRGTAKGRDEEQKLKEQKLREGWMELLFEDKPSVFEISYAALKAIVLDIVFGRKISYRTQENQLIESPAEIHFYKVLEDCIATRNYFYDQLKVAGEEPQSVTSLKIKKLFNSVFIDYSNYSHSINEVFYSPEQLRHLPIAATPKIEQKLIAWHQSLTFNKTNELVKRKQLLNVIRPPFAKFDNSIYKGILKNGRTKQKPDNTDSEPLLFQLSYYYKEQTQKGRREDAWVEWAAQYLMDFGLVKDWYWEVEKYVFEKKFESSNEEESLKKNLLYVKKLPGNHRMRIQDGLVTIGISKKEIPVESKDFHKFRLNGRLLQFLIIMILEGKNETLINTNEFLLAIKRDVECLLNDEEDTLALLEDFTIPGYLKIQKPTQKQTTLQQELKKFIDGKIKWMDTSVAEMKNYSRNEKNKIILEAYQLFDFSGTEGKKFFRKNEYEQMSVCHYLLNQTPSEVPKMVRTVFRMENRMPCEILNLLCSCKNMDVLFTEVLRNRRAFLKELLRNQVTAADIPSKHLRKLADSLHVKLPSYLLSPENQKNRKELTSQNKEHIPFVVHPLLVLKYYFPIAFKNGEFSPNTQSGKETYRNILKEFRDKHYDDALLVSEYYVESRIDAFLPPSILKNAGDDNVKSIEKLTMKWKGVLIEAKTSDLLLWKMAMQYVETYDRLLHKELLGLGRNQVKQLTDIFRSSILVELKREDVSAFKPDIGKKKQHPFYTTEQVKAMPKTIYLKLLMHQVDDYFFRKQKENLYQLACHFVMRRQEELELYAGNETICEKILKWPDGSMEKPVLLGDLINERKICAGFGKELMQYIFDYERRVLDGYTEREIGGRFDSMDAGKKKEKRHRLLQVFQKKDNKYIGFNILEKLEEQSMKTPSDLFKEISNLRNQCMHSKIPLAGSFRKLAMPQTKVGELLQITEAIGKDKSAENRYELDANIDVI